MRYHRIIAGLACASIHQPTDDDGQLRERNGTGTL